MLVFSSLHKNKTVCGGHYNNRGNTKGFCFIESLHDASFPHFRHDKRQELNMSRLEILFWYGFMK